MRTLKRTGSRVKNQLDSLTDRPTLRWIFQCFQSSHIYVDRGIKQISNINKERLHTREILSPSMSAVLFTGVTYVKTHAQVMSRT